jgi:extracellular factor (EF) 3-hydroxypalmitic acid methyl ester biosynthesis protein
MANVNREARNAIDDGYRGAVHELRCVLCETRAWIAEQEVRVASLPGLAGGTTLPESVTAPLARKFVELLDDFELSAGRVSPADATHRAFVQRELHPLLLGAPVAARCFHKPLGFAGDYEKVNMMLGESPTEAGDTFTHFVDEVLTNVPVAQAHRNRIAILEQSLVDEAIRVRAKERMCGVLSVGCGPALEIRRFLPREELSGNCIIHLVDFNVETLEHVRGRAQSILARAVRPPILRLFHQSVEDIVQSPPGRGDQRRAAYDFVYCTGLFDYLADDICRALLQVYQGWLRPGGLLLISNVHPGNPHRYCMEHLVDWYLTYRDAKQMRALLPQGIEARIFHDTTGLNVFLSLRG